MLKIHRIVAATDCGNAVNPQQIEAQVEGSFVYGLSAALYQECTVKNGRIEQTNCNYPTLKMADMPKVETVLVPSGGFWGGVGEPTIAVAAPAVLNAVFAATGSAFRLAAQEPQLEGVGAVALPASISQRLASLALMLVSIPRHAQIVQRTVLKDEHSYSTHRASGDVNRGREIASSRQIGMCILCHQIPNSPDKFQGDIATQLAGAGARWSVPQLRLRIVDSRRMNAESVMPRHKVAGLSRVGAAWRDKPILDAQQVEDVVAWLATLK